MNSRPPLFCALPVGAEPATINLWGEQIPRPVSGDPKNVPTLTIQLADKEKANHTAVVICPGGGYSGRATGHEGRRSPPGSMNVAFMRSSKGFSPVSASVEED